MTDSDLASWQISELDAQGALNGLTPLHDAVWHGHLEVVKILVAAGSPLHLRTHAGHTARELAVLYGYEDLAVFLADAERSSGSEAGTGPRAQQRRDNPTTSKTRGER